MFFIVISAQTVNCGRFWFQPCSTHSAVEEIHSELNSRNAPLEPFRNKSELKVDLIVAANYPSEDGSIDWHRGKIVSIDIDHELQETVAIVSVETSADKQGKQFRL